MSAPRPASLPALTGLRFVAAAAVLASHFAPFPALTASDAGYAAVTLFFLLSGFILTYTAPPGRPSVRAFYVARVARIYPAYLLGLMLTVATRPTSAFDCPSQTAAFVPSLLVVQAWFPDRGLCLNGPAWSVSCEFFFYALFPLLLPLLRRVPPARLPIMGIASWVASMGTSVPFLATSPAGDLGGALFRLLYLSPTARLPEFVCGMVLGQMYVRGVRLARPGLATALALLWLPVVQYGVGLFGPLDDALCLPAFAALLLALAQPSLPARLLAHRALVVLGEASYGLYITHWPLHGLLAGLRLWSPLLGGWPAFGAYAVLCVSCALLSLRVLETPARHIIRMALAPAKQEGDRPCRVAAPTSPVPMMPCSIDKAIAGAGDR